MFIANAVLPIEGRTGNDHQIRALQPARHLVEIGVVRRESRDALATLQQRIHRTKRLFDNLLHAHESRAQCAFPKAA